MLDGRTGAASSAGLQRSAAEIVLAQAISKQNTGGLQQCANMDQHLHIGGYYGLITCLDTIICAPESSRCHPIPLRRDERERRGRRERPLKTTEMTRTLARKQISHKDVSGLLRYGTFNLLKLTCTATAIDQTDKTATDHDANSAIPDTSETQQPKEQSSTKFPELPERRKPLSNESPSSASAATKETIPVNSEVGVSEATGDDVATEATGQPGQSKGTDKFDKQGTTSQKNQDTRATSSYEPAKAKAKARPETAADIAMKSLATRFDRVGRQFEAQDFAGKRDRGNQGAAVKLQTNHFEIELPRLSTIYQYSFTIWPFPTSLRMCRRILYLLLRNSNGFSKAATDYRSLIVSTAKLVHEDFSANFEVDYYGEGETGPRTDDERTTYTVSIFPVREASHELNLLDLHTYIRDPTSRTDINPKPLITALNLFLNRMPNQNPMVACLGKNTFYDLDKNSSQWHADLGNPRQLTLEALIGIYKSVKVCPQKLLMNANTSASAFYAQQSMDWLIHAWSGEDEQGQYRDLVQLTRFIRGLRVQAKHGRRRVYTVWGVAKWGPRYWDGRRPTKDVVTFTKKNKKSGEYEEITVEAYFSEGKLAAFQILIHY